MNFIFHNTDDKIIDMPLNSLSTNTISSTTTAAVHEKPSDTTELESPNNSKKIKIQLQIFLLMVMFDHLKQKENIITVSLHRALKHL